MESFLAVLESFKDFLWDNFLVYALLFVGIYLTIKLGLPQITSLKKIFTQPFKGMFDKDSEGVSSFQALATSVAGQVGTGNIGGVATAIVAGGPGAVFWMWVSGLLGMSTIFGEAILAQKFREKRNGNWVGGPAFYISKGLKNKKLGKILGSVFAILIILALGLIGNMVQSNSMSVALESGFGFNPLVVGVIVAIVAALIFVGGINRIASFAEILVPIMAIIYFIGSIVIMIKFHDNIIPVFKDIFTQAFSGRAAMGAIAGISVKQAVKLGLARGLFSNEAGMGSTPHAHAVAEVKHPAQQGFVAMFGVIIDTFVICSVTALIILTTKADIVASQEGLNSVQVTQKAFEIAFGNIGIKFLGISLLFFAFTTIIGWYYFGESNIRYLFGKKGLIPYRILVMIFIVLGAKFEIDIVWDLADLFNGLMIIPNLIALLLLSGIISATLKEFKDNEDEYL
ncbi:MAG: sodium:alanine symporter family protein [Andreesenia angusta]|nr:sodium:alanine symporter family protein [Andreesenia angusta]